MIEVRGLSYSYGSRNAIHDISFSAEGGTVLGILGNNGAGKSTLITCLDMIRTPDEGSVTIDGRSVITMSRKEIARLVSYVPQRSEVSGMSVFDCILLGRRPYFGWGADERDIEACRSVIRRMRLEGLAFRRMDELSGGEQQKAMVARALVQEPAVMLLDEPTSSLDPRNQNEVMALVRNAAREDGIAVIAVLHDLNLALRFCDRLFFMKDGTGFRCCSSDEVDSATISGAYGIDSEIVTVGGRRFVLMD